VQPVLECLVLADRDEADAGQGARVGPDDDLVLGLEQHAPVEDLAPEAGQ
jgi:hypothetical protein